MNEDRVNLNLMEDDLETVYSHLGKSDGRRTQSLAVS